MTNEPRSVWLILKDGRPVGCTWALAKTDAEGERIGPSMGKSPSWVAALDADQLEADGWDAKPTTWRRVPELVQPFHLQDDQTDVEMESNRVRVAGVAYNFDTKGEDRGKGKEPHEPDADEDINEDKLLAQAERKGAKIRFRDKAKKRWVAHHEDGEPAEDADVKLYKEGGVKKRKNKE
jgi:hypothetical protein